MLNIRKGIFETNSSSTHAMVVANEPYTTPSVVTARIDSYGWGRDILTTPDEKLSYLYTAACDFYGRDMQKEISDILARYGVRMEISRFPVFKGYGKNKYLDNGHLDHCGEAEEFIDAVLNDGELLMRYLFCVNSFVVTTNDADDSGWWERHLSVDFAHRTFYKYN